MIEVAVSAASQQASSMLEKTARLRVADARATMVNDRVLALSLPESASASFTEVWKKQRELAHFALTTELAPGADGQSIWIPGSTEKSATCVGDRIPKQLGLAFVLPHAAGDENELLLLEDGAALRLTPESFRALREALCVGKELELALSSGKLLRVWFRPKKLVDPLTDNEHYSRSGWERYEPDRPRVDGNSRVAPGLVTLLVAEEALAQRITSAALAAYLLDIEHVMEGAAVEVSAPRELGFVLGLELTPGQPAKVALRCTRGEAGSLLDALLGAVRSVTAPEVSGAVPLRMEFAVRGTAN